MLEKSSEKKNDKEKRILEASYTLFTTKGINNTSIQDIVENAGIAKGTFYLYFKDKYDLQEKLITKLSHDLFNKAMLSVKEKNISKFDDQIIAIIDYVIDSLVKKPEPVSYTHLTDSFILFSVILPSSTALFTLFKAFLEDDGIKSISTPASTAFTYISSCE